MLLLLEPLIGAIVPMLVKLAEEKFTSSGAGAEKHAWVNGMVLNFFTDFESKMPGFLKPAESEIEILVTNAIESALEKFGL